MAVSDPWNDFLNFNVESSIAKPGEIIFCHIAGVDYDRKGKIIGYLLENNKLKGNPYISVDDYEKYYSPDDEVIFVKVVTQDDEDGNTIVDPAAAHEQTQKNMLADLIANKSVIKRQVIHETDKAFILEPLFDGQNWSVNKRDSKYLHVDNTIEVIVQRAFPGGGVQCSNREVRLLRKQEIESNYPLNSFHRVKLGKTVKGSYVGEFKDGTRWSMKRAEAMPNAKFFSAGSVIAHHGETVILECKSAVSKYLDQYVDGKVIPVECFYNNHKGVVLALVQDCPVLSVKVMRASLSKPGEVINVVVERKTLGKTTARRI